MYSLVAGPQPSVTQDLLPLQEGYTVATCFSGALPGPTATRYVVVIQDTSPGELGSAPLGLPGGYYPWKRFHNELGLGVPAPPAPLSDHVWNRDNLGEVFGITLDQANNPNIYVTASTVFGIYNAPTSNSGHRGTVYKLDGTTGEITLFANLPAVANGASLGNIAHHQTNAGQNRFYVSNLEDGKIYQLNNTGGYNPITDVYDHGVQGRVAAGLGAIPDSGTPGLTRSGRRVWGLEDHDGRLYYGVWYDPGQAQEVWSVALNPSGQIMPGTAQVEITLPFLSAFQQYSMPVSDITFSPNGDLVIAERYHRYNSGVPATSVPPTFTSPHRSRVLEYTGTSGAWTASPVNKYVVGMGAGRNSAGGVGVNCDGLVWASGDALILNAPENIYGLQGMDGTGSTLPANSYLIDLDAEICSQDKTQIGDVEVLADCGSCFRIDREVVECPQEPGAPYTYIAGITNLSSDVATAIRFTPCPGNSLPAGATTLPSPQVQTLSPPLAPNASTAISLNLAGFHGGEKVCFLVSLLDRTGKACCSEKVCIELPICEDPCFRVEIKGIDCEISADGRVKYFVKGCLTNLSSFHFYHGTIQAPAGPTILTNTSPTPFIFDWTAAPIAPGDTAPFELCITGATPGTKLCFLLAAHSETIEECCGERICIELPRCGDPVVPDNCRIKAVSHCCPQEGFAEVVFAVCNNSNEPRAYDWNLGGLTPTQECTGILTTGQFSPSSGTTPIIAPGRCHIVRVKIDCRRLKPGECACYFVAFTQVGNPANSFRCKAIVKRPRIWVVKEPVQDEVVAVPSVGPDPIRLPFEVTNVSEERATLDYQILSNGLLLLSSQTARQPSTILRGRLTLGAGETQIVEVEVSNLEHDNPLFEGNGDVKVNALFNEIRLFGGTAGTGNDANELLAEAFVQSVREIGEGVRPAVDGEPGVKVKNVALARNQRIAIEFATEEDVTYKVQFCDDLQSGWADVACASSPEAPLEQNVLEGNGETLTFFTEVDGRQGFFRVVER